MCKSTTGTQAAAGSTVRGIQPNTAGGTGGNGPGPDPEISTAQPLFGEPDYAPQLTFIAQASPTDNGFIALAVQFHENSGMNPITVRSIQEIIDILDDSSRSGTGHLNRIRIVSHVFFDASGRSQPINMLLRFLTGGRGPALKRHYEGFAGSTIDALKSMMTFELLTFTDISHFFYRGSSSTLMSFMRPTHNSIIDLVPTDPFGEPTGEFNDFFMICGSLWALSRLPSTIFNATQKATLQRAYTTLLTDVISRISSTVPQPQLIVLRDAITGLGNTQSLTHQTPHNPLEYVQNVEAALTAIAGNAFETKRNRVRQRFNQNSKIDIRGCQVGRDPDFLAAVQRFFGTSATVRPAVSGPRWFQHFNTIGNISGINSNNRIVGLHNSGFVPYSAAQVRQFLNDWGTAFGITDAHLTFWRTTFGLDTLSFCALGWRASIPGTRIPIVRLQALSGADFEALVRGLVTLFFTPGNRTPNNAAYIAINPILSNLANWASQLNAAVDDSATPAQLTTHFNNYKTIYEGVDKRFTGTASPSAAQRVIPATVPNPLNANVVRTLQTDLKTFIDTHAQSRLRPFKRFIDATLTQVNDAPAKMRYFLSLGLPFLVYNPASTNVNHNILVVFLDGNAVVNKRQDEAIKYWIRAQWRGIIPTNLAAGTTFENSKESPWLVENRQPTNFITLHPFRISPTTEFHAEIVSITP